MSIKEGVEARIMQNPGDPRPEGVARAPARRVLILDLDEEDALLVERVKYDDVFPLYKNGHRPSREDESGELKATTISGEPLDKGQTSL